MSNSRSKPAKSNVFHGLVAAAVTFYQIAVSNLVKTVKRQIVKSNCPRHGAPGHRDADVPPVHGSLPSTHDPSLAVG